MLRSLAEAFPDEISTTEPIELTPGQSAYVLYCKGHYGERTDVHGDLGGLVCNYAAFNPAFVQGDKPWIYSVSHMRGILEAVYGEERANAKIAKEVLEIVMTPHPWDAENVRERVARKFMSLIALMQVFSIRADRDIVCTDNASPSFKSLSGEIRTLNPAAHWKHNRKTS